MVFRLQKVENFMLALRDFLLFVMLDQLMKAVMNVLREILLDTHQLVWY